MPQKVYASHSVVYRAPAGMPLRYFGWPTVTRLGNGKLVVGASGFRVGHVCPFGTTVVWESADEGATWSDPWIVNNAAVDDRDVGVTPLTGGDFLVSWFASDTRHYHSWLTPQVNVVAGGWDDAVAKASVGSFVRKVNFDGTYGPTIPVRVSSPHGPIRLADGRLFYLGADFATVGADGKLSFSMGSLDQKVLLAMISSDEGATWSVVGKLDPGTSGSKYCEPHALELPDGRILGAIRDESNFSTLVTESADGGATWSAPVRVIESGAPPHLMLHSSGTIVLSFGYRLAPYGERAILSRDGGRTWSDQVVIHDDGVTGDLGYPASVELTDGSILTVYYQALPGDGHFCSILSSKWELPEA